MDLALWRRVPIDQLSKGTARFFEQCLASVSLAIGQMQVTTANGPLCQAIGDVARVLCAHLKPRCAPSVVAFTPQRRRVTEDAVLRGSQRTTSTDH
jgi:hypothetical protein